MSESRMSNPELVDMLSRLSEARPELRTLSEVCLAYGKELARRERDSLCSVMESFVHDWERGSRRTVKGCTEDVRTLIRLLRGVSP